MSRLSLVCTAFWAVLIVSCTPRPITPAPVPAGPLTPYSTVTPSATPEQPEGLVVSFETPLPSPTPFAYTVERGDTLSGIALKFGVSLDELLAANPDVSPNAMSVGTILQIPSNPVNPDGVPSPTPVPAPVEQIECHPTADRGLWCFALVYNDLPDMLENVTAQVSLAAPDGTPVGTQTAILPLNVLPPYTALPVMVFFGPGTPADAVPQVLLLTATRLEPGDDRYLPATVQNALVQVGWRGRTARVSGEVRLAEGTGGASRVWVAAVAYDEAGRVVGARRWESDAGIPPGGSLPFSFEVSSLAGVIRQVDFAVEVRP